MVPAVIADSGVAFHTSNTVMRIDELPARLAILGGGYIAAEFAHVFSALGVDVTMIVRGDGLLRHLDRDIASRFTRIAQHRWDVRLGTEVTAATTHGAGIRLELTHGRPVDADLLLVATGRTPNSDRLGLEAAGIGVRADGRIATDEFQRTAAPGVWALGDVSSVHQLKHVANREARMVAHNLTHPDDLRSADERFVPAAVFTDPQLAGVGLTEQQAIEAGYQIVTSIQQYADTAYGWAMEDTSSICKVIADRTSGLLLGAHLMGPQASTLIQPLIQAMQFGQRATDVARGQFWIHPALSEVVENALLGLHLD